MSVGNTFPFLLNYHNPIHNRSKQISFHHSSIIFPSLHCIYKKIKHTIKLDAISINNAL